MYANLYTLSSCPVDYSSTVDTLFLRTLAPLRRTSSSMLVFTWCSYNSQLCC